jgi:hypothetical protein
MTTEAGGILVRQAGEVNEAPEGALYAPFHSLHGSDMARMLSADRVFSGSP